MLYFVGFLVMSCRSIVVYNHVLTSNCILFDENVKKTNLILNEKLKKINLILTSLLFSLSLFLSAACVACGNFILCFPDEARGSMEELYPFFYTNLEVKDEKERDRDREMDEGLQ